LTSSYFCAILSTDEKFIGFSRSTTVAIGVDPILFYSIRRIIKMADTEGTYLEYNWDEGISETKQGTGDILFIGKEEKTIFKPIWQADIDGKWFERFETMFKGNKKPTIQYAVKGVIKSGGEIMPVVAVFKQSQMSQIMQIGKSLKEDEGVNLLGIKAPLISIKREGTGMQTKYFVAPGTKEFDASEYADSWEVPLSDYVSKLTSPKEEKEEKVDLFEEKAE